MFYINSFLLCFRSGLGFMALSTARDVGQGIEDRSIIHGID